MDAKQLHRLRADLAFFLDELMPDRLGNATRRRWAEVYLRGLLLDGHRKSIEPMARRLRDTDGGASDYEQALQQFINSSTLQTWSSRLANGSMSWGAGEAGTPRSGPPYPTVTVAR
jgi:SRSO17 transposase